MEKLPLEILHIIVHELPRPKDRASLSQVSKTMHQVMMPLLYRKKVVLVSEDHLYKLELPLVKTCFKESGSRDIFNTLQFLKDLELVAPISHYQKERCYSNKQSGEKKNHTHKIFMSMLNDAFQQAFFHLPENSLKSFSWHLGCCIPSQILDLLSSKQHQIRSLSLITDGTCSKTGKNLDGLLKFTELRTLSWKGLCPGEHDDLLRIILKANSKHLESIELEPVGSLDFNRDVSFRFKDAIMPKDIVEFSSLQHLSLSHIDIGSAYKRMTSAFRMEQLRSLKLLECSRTLRFLDKVVSSSQVFKLRSLEISVHHAYAPDTYDETHPLGLFLKSFEGLEELYIRIQDIVYHMETVLGPILHHKRSLKRLVHHERGFVRDEESGILQFRDGTIPWARDAGTALLEMSSLECIGVSLPPSLLRQEFEPKAAHHTFKLLHLPTTPFYYVSMAWVDPVDVVNGRVKLNNPKCVRYVQDVFDFAQWAFSPSGLPKLMVIACGKFTQNQEFNWPEFLLTRDPNSPPRCFRTDSGKDYIHILDEIDGARQMLSVFSMEQLLNFDDDSDDSDDSSDSSNSSQ